MSKIGKKPIQIPEGVTVEQARTRLLLRGNQGQTEFTVPSNFTIVIKDGLLSISRLSSQNPAAWGRLRSEIANAVLGVSDGWSKKLDVVGTGYRATTDGKTLNLNLGFSHPVVVAAPEGVKFEVAANKITVLGIDKILVGQVASNIKKIRPPDSYKGKGIIYSGEVIRKKAGKASKGLGGVT